MFAGNSRHQIRKSLQGAGDQPSKQMKYLLSGLYFSLVLAGCPEPKTPIVIPPVRTSSIARTSTAAGLEEACRFGKQRLDKADREIIFACHYESLFPEQCLQSKKDFAEARRLYQETCLDRKGNQEE